MTLQLSFIVLIAILTIGIGWLYMKWNEVLLDKLDETCVNIRDSRSEKNLRPDKLITMLIYSDTIEFIVVAVIPILSLLFGIAISIDLFDVEVVGTAYLYRTIPIVLGMGFVVLTIFYVMFMLFIYILRHTRSV